MVAAPHSIDSSFCDNQKLSEINHIQEFGVLIVLEKPSLKILQVSTNASDIFGALPGELVGKNFADQLPPEDSESLCVKIKALEGTQILLRPITFISGRTFISTIRESDECYLLEVEYINEVTEQNDKHSLYVYESLSRFKANIQAGSDIQGVCESIVHAIRQETSFDRVMVYKFSEDLHGEIVAEQKCADLESFLGLWFPATDIPKPARELYQTVPVRTIYSIDYQPVPLYPAVNGVTGRPTNLSGCRLRAIMPVHLEYLRNMGVRASVSMRILHEGNLWGLIVCHHRSPRILTIHQIQFLELLSSFCSAEISIRISISKNSELEWRRAELRAFEQQMDSSSDVSHGIRLVKNVLARLLGVTSLAYFHEGKADCLINNLPAEFIKQLDMWLSQRQPAEIFSSHNLAGEIPEAIAFAEVASGIIVIPVDFLQRKYVVGLRAEFVEQIQWAGDPSRAVIHNVDGRGYHPRASFSKWLQTVRNTSKKWSKEEIVFANRIRAKVIERTMLEYSVGLEEKIKDRTAEIESAKAQLERLHEELKQSTFLTTHHIQEAVRKMTMLGDLLKSKAEKLHLLDDEVTLIIEQSERIRHLIWELERYSRAGEEDDLGSIDLNSIVADVLIELRGVIKKNQTRINVAALPVVSGVYSQLKQVFLIVLDNAIKFSRHSSNPTVNISWNNKGERDTSYDIEVEDNGIGIEPMAADQGFSLFTKLHSDPRFEGEGVGLAIAQKIMRHHKGVISIESDGSTGTKVIVRFPSFDEYSRFSPQNYT